MNRVLLYVHFNKNDRLSEYVVYQLIQMRKLFDEIVFISNSSLPNDDKRRIGDVCDGVLIRKNSGYDFAAWRDGIKMIGWSKLSKFDSITLMNDTCFGPVYPMDNVYKKMENMDIDFWGITDHAASPDGMPGSNDPIPSHIQSYMTVYNRNVVGSKIFHDFWNNVNDHQDVTEVIRRYETQLTRILKKAKFTYKVLFNTEEYSKIHKILLYNYSELLPLILIRNSVPLLKIKSFKHTPARLIKYELRKTSYPLELVDGHLKLVNIKTVGLLKYYLKSMRISLIRRLKMVYNKSNEK